MLGYVQFIQSRSEGGVNVSTPIFEWTAGDERGQGMVEYGLIIVIAVFVALGPQIQRMFSNTAGQDVVNEGQQPMESTNYSDTGMQSDTGM